MLNEEEYARDREADAMEKKWPLIAVFWLLVIVLGIFYTWDCRHLMNPDGMSYLDIGDAYSSGNWKNAINGYWSPFYPYILSLAIALLKPSPYWEFTVAHLVNFLIYLCAWGCFNFFLFELLRYNRLKMVNVSGDKVIFLPEWALLLLGYTLFIWTSLYLISIFMIGPDMCNAAFVYLISGLLLRIRRRNRGWFTFILLGIILGFAYLTRTFMFLLAFIFLGISLFSIGNLKKAIPRLIIALVFFLSIGGPFIITLSNTKGYLTFGDTATVIYALGTGIHWQGESVGTGKPEHPTKKLYNNPEIYEFSSPIRGTYPPWYDPYYWTKGYIFHFNLSKQIKILISNLKVLFKIFSELPMVVLINSSLIFYLINRRRRLWVKDIMGEYWNLYIPAISALVMFLLTHLESRYIGVFIVLLWMAIFASLRFSESQRLEALMKSIVYAIVILIMGFVITLSLPKVYNVVSSLIRGEEKSTHIHWQVADTLKKQIGIKPQDRVACIGDAYYAYWARLARVKIVAEMPTRSVINFLAADESVRHQVIKIFEGTGAKVVVTREIPQTYAALFGWQRIKNTGYYVYILK